MRGRTKNKRHAASHKFQHMLQAKELERTMQARPIGVRRYIYTCTFFAYVCERVRVYMFTHTHAYIYTYMHIA